MFFSNHKIIHDSCPVIMKVTPNPAGSSVSAILPFDELPGGCNFTVPNRINVCSGYKIRDICLNNMALFRELRSAVLQNHFTG